MHKIAILSLCLTLTGLPVSVLAAPGGAVESVSTKTVSVSSKSELIKALHSITQPTTIFLQRGSYGHLRLTDAALPPGTTISSSDSRRPASFDGISLKGIRNLKLANISIAPPASGTVAGRYGMLILNSRHVDLENVDFHGSTRWRGQKSNSGLMIRNSSNVTVSKSYFTKFQHGISIQKVRNTTIELNEFERLRTDAIRGGGVNRLEIRGNVVTNFEPAKGDHPDGIQLWSTRQKEPGRYVTVEDNLVVRGSGDPIQGIFIRDTRLRLPFRDLNISGNLVIGGLYNGITVLGAEDVRVNSNTVLARKDQKSWIRLEYTRDARITGNSANAFVINNNRAKPRLSGNQTNSASNGDMSRLISKWARSKKVFASHRGEVLQRLMRYGR